MTHTPGPWEIKYSQSGRPYQIRAVDVSADVTRWGGISMPASEEGQSNARLISAAPDLLEFALEFKKLRVAAGSMAFDNETLEAMCDAAIAKATGAS